MTLPSQRKSREKIMRNQDQAVIDFIKEHFQGMFLASEYLQSRHGIENCSIVSESIRSNVSMGIIFLNGKKITSVYQKISEFPTVKGEDVLTIRYGGRTQFYFPKIGTGTLDYDRILYGTFIG
jgi:hypothetical protein